MQSLIGEVSGDKAIPRLMLSPWSPTPPTQSTSRHPPHPHCVCHHLSDSTFKNKTRVVTGGFCFVFLFQYSIHFPVYHISFKVEKGLNYTHKPSPRYSTAWFRSQTTPKFHVLILFRVEREFSCFPFKGEREQERRKQWEVYSDQGDEKKANWCGCWERPEPWNHQRCSLLHLALTITWSKPSVVELKPPYPSGIWNSKILCL